MTLKSAARLLLCYREPVRPVVLVWLTVCIAFGALGCSSSADVARGPSASLRAYADALADNRAEDAYRLLSDDAKRSISFDAFRRMVKESRDDMLEIARTLRRSASDPVVTASVQTPEGEELTLVYESGSWRVDGTGIERYGQSTPRQALLGFLRAFDRRRYDIIMRYVPDKERQGAAETAWGPQGKASPPASAEATAAPSSASAGAPAPSATPSPSSGVASSKAASSAEAAQPTSGSGASDANTPDQGGLSPEKLRQSWEGDQKEYVSRIVQAIKAALPTASIEETQDRAAMPYGAGGTVLFVREHGLWKIEDL
jgi:hypothetical protein